MWWRNGVFMFQNDFVMREIEGLTRFLGTILTQKKKEEEIIDSENVVSGDGLFLHQLLLLVSEGKINKAEDMLFEELDDSFRTSLLDMAIKFYSHLNQLTDQQLDAANFSREEIAEGLAAVKNICIM